MSVINSLESLTHCGTKLWLDSIDPDLTTLNKNLGATGATSNPIIVADLIKTGRFDRDLLELKSSTSDPSAAAWAVTDKLVTLAEKVFKDIFDRTKGDDGYVSFEVDPLLEDASCQLSLSEKVSEYIRLAKKWSVNHPNRMIKVPATEAGLASLTDIVSAGIPVNVTLIFSERQYLEARKNVWSGAKKLADLSRFKSVYSIFVSRLDIYAEKKYPDLICSKEGLVGILNAKHIWRLNQEFWKSNKTPLKQEMIFASTGTKKPSDLAWKYVQALAGSDIQTNPPATNDLTAKSGVTFTNTLAQIDNPTIVDECAKKIDWPKLEMDLMNEGLAKFADPQKALLEIVASRFK
jgi:transaldolase